MANQPPVAPKQGTRLVTQGLLWQPGATKQVAAVFLSPSTIRPIERPRNSDVWLRTKSFLPSRIVVSFGVSASANGTDTSMDAPTNPSGHLTANIRKLMGSSPSGLIRARIQGLGFAIWSRTMLPIVPRL